MIRQTIACAVSALFATTLVAAPEAEMPAGEAESEFRELLTNSPFTRSLNLSSSLVLTGIATIGGESIATILDTASKQSYVVSGDDSNSQGWRMVEIEGDRMDLETVTARISVTGGEVIAVRFNDVQLKPGESKPADARRGDGDGPRPPRGDGQGRPEGGKGGKGMKGKGKGERTGSGLRDGSGAKGGGGKGGKGGGQKGGAGTGGGGDQGGGGRSASS